MENIKNNTFPISVTFSLLETVFTIAELYPPQKTISKKRNDFAKTVFLKEVSMGMF